MVNTITVGKNPQEVTVNPNNNIIYVTDSNDCTVSIINSSSKNNVANTIKVGKILEGVTVNPNNNMVYVANFGNDTVSRISIHDQQ